MIDVNKEIKIGDVVLDSYDRLGIVDSVRERPSDEWLEAQSDDRVRLTPAGVRWFSVCPLDGGAVNSPENSTMYVRRPTIEDLRKAIRSPGGFTQEEIVKLFPEQMSELLGNSKPIWWLLTLHNSEMNAQEPIQVEACDAHLAERLAKQLISDDWSVLHAEPFQE